MNKVEKYIKDNNIKGYLSSALDRLSGSYLYDYFGIEVL